MHKMIRRLYASAAIAGAVLSPQAQAVTQVAVVPSAVILPLTVIDFDALGLTGLYLNGDSFTQSGFKMTVDFDAGVVDVGTGLGGAAPSGNSTQFYTQLNEGGLIVERSGGGLFNLSSFDAAFVPLDPAAAGTTVIVAVGVYDNNTTTGVAWSFASSGTPSRPFSTYNNPLDFASFTNLKLVEFYACAYDGVNVCSGPLQNNGQFAIDNITVSVPEPATTVMLTLGLLGLALRSRRSAR